MPDQMSAETRALLEATPSDAAFSANTGSLSVHRLLDQHDWLMAQPTGDARDGLLKWVSWLLAWAPEKVQPTATPGPEMTREERYNALTKRYPFAIPGSEDENPRRYAGVATDGSDYWITTSSSFTGCADYLAAEVLGEVSWTPIAIFDLDTGESIPIRTMAYVISAPGTSTEPGPWEA